MSLRFHATPLLEPSGSPDWSTLAGAQQGRSRDGAIKPALLAHGAAAAGLAKLVEGGALAVTTGQQAGLFTGPLYTVLKALSAAALAREMTEAGLGNVVPVFWVAGDDHDFAEINHCTVTGADGKPARVVLRERPADAAMLPAYRETLGNDAARALGELEAALPPGDARAETLAWLGRSYTAGNSLAEANAQALAELLGPYGVVVARGWDGSLKTAAREQLLRAAIEARALDEALAREASLMRDMDVPAPVEVGQGLSLLMIEASQGRDRLRIAGPGVFETRRSGEKFTLADLERILGREPERLSGNVLLRPAIEAAVFPTIGYFGGPGELAYLGQTGPVFDLLGVPRPARLARLSGLLVDPKVDKVLERHHLAPEDLAQDAGALTSRVAREALPETAAWALAELRNAITERYARVQSEAAHIDKTLERTAENARNQALVGAQEIEKKLVAALKRANEAAIQQITRARDQLYPDGVAQERVISVVSFLARYGRDATGLLFDAARRHAKRHLVAPSRRA